MSHEGIFYFLINALFHLTKINYDILQGFETFRSISLSFTLKFLKLNLKIVGILA